jgi:hypothetical protein
MGYITQRSPQKFNRRFGGTYHFNLMGQRICCARYQRESSWLAEVWQNNLFPCPDEITSRNTSRFLQSL